MLWLPWVGCLQHAKHLGMLHLFRDAMVARGGMFTACKALGCAATVSRCYGCQGWGVYSMQNIWVCCNCFKMLWLPGVGCLPHAKHLGMLQLFQDAMVARGGVFTSCKTFGCATIVSRCYGCQGWDVYNMQNIWVCCNCFKMLWLPGVGCLQHAKHLGMLQLFQDAMVARGGVFTACKTFGYAATISRCYGCQGWDVYSMQNTWVCCNCFKMLWLPGLGCLQHAKHLGMLQLFQDAMVARGCQHGGMFTWLPCKSTWVCCNCFKMLWLPGVGCLQHAKHLGMLQLFQDAMVARGGMFTACLCCNCFKMLWLPGVGCLQHAKHLGMLQLFQDAMVARVGMFTACKTFGYAATVSRCYGCQGWDVYSMQNIWVCCNCFKMLWLPGVGCLQHAKHLGMLQLFQDAMVARGGMFTAQHANAMLGYVATKHLLLQDAMVARGGMFTACTNIWVCCNCFKMLWLPGMGCLQHAKHLGMLQLFQDAMVARGGMFTACKTFGYAATVSRCYGCQGWDVYIMQNIWVCCNCFKMLWLPGVGCLQHAKHLGMLQLFQDAMVARGGMFTACKALGYAATVSRCYGCQGWDVYSMQNIGVCLGMVARGATKHLVSRCYGCQGWDVYSMQSTWVCTATVSRYAGNCLGKMLWLPGVGCLQHAKHLGMLQLFQDAMVARGGMFITCKTFGYAATVSRCYGCQGWDVYSMQSTWVCCICFKMLLLPGVGCLQHAKHLGMLQLFQDAMVARGGMFTACKTFGYAATVSRCYGCQGWDVYSMQNIWVCCNCFKMLWLPGVGCLQHAKHLGMLQLFQDAMVARGGMFTACKALGCAATVSRCYGCQGWDVYSMQNTWVCCNCFKMLWLPGVGCLQHAKHLGMLQLFQDAMVARGGMFTACKTFGMLYAKHLGVLQLFQDAMVARGGMFTTCKTFGYAATVSRCYGCQGWDVYSMQNIWVCAATVSRCYGKHPTPARGGMFTACKTLGYDATVSRCYGCQGWDVYSMQSTWVCCNCFKMLWLPGVGCLQHGKACKALGMLQLFQDAMVARGGMFTACKTFGYASVVTICYGCQGWDVYIMQNIWVCCNYFKMLWLPGVGCLQHAKHLGMLQLFQDAMVARVGMFTACKTFGYAATVSRCYGCQGWDVYSMQNIWVCCSCFKMLWLPGLGCLQHAKHLGMLQLFRHAMVARGGMFTACKALGYAATVSRCYGCQGWDVYSMQNIWVCCNYFKMLWLPGVGCLQHAKHLGMLQLFQDAMVARGGVFASCKTFGYAATVSRCYGCQGWDVYSMQNIWVCCNCFKMLWLPGVGCLQHAKHLGMLQLFQDAMVARGGMFTACKALGYAATVSRCYGCHAKHLGMLQLFQDAMVARVGMFTACKTFMVCYATVSRCYGCQGWDVYSMQNIWVCCNYFKMLWLPGVGCLQHAKHLGMLQLFQDAMVARGGMFTACKTFGYAATVSRCYGCQGWDVYSMQNIWVCCNCFKMLWLPGVGCLQHAKHLGMLQLFQDAMVARGGVFTACKTLRVCWNCFKMLWLPGVGCLQHAKHLGMLQLFQDAMVARGGMFTACKTLGYAATVSRCYGCQGWDVYSMQNIWVCCNCFKMLWLPGVGCLHHAMHLGMLQLFQDAMVARGGMFTACKALGCAATVSRCYGCQGWDVYSMQNIWVCCNCFKMLWLPGVGCLPHAQHLDMMELFQDAMVAWVGVFTACKTFWYAATISRCYGCQGWDVYSMQSIWVCCNCFKMLWLPGLGCLQHACKTFARGMSACNCFARCYGCQGWDVYSMQNIWVCCNCFKMLWLPGLGCLQHAKHLGMLQLFQDAMVARGGMFTACKTFGYAATVSRCYGCQGWDVYIMQNIWVCCNCFKMLWLPGVGCLQHAKHLGMLQLFQDAMVARGGMFTACKTFGYAATVSRCYGCQGWGVCIMQNIWVCCNCFKML